ncbi:MAG: hypothetical protein Q9227_008842 [Pyrenula ochraceoflavens]
MPLPLHSLAENASQQKGAAERYFSTFINMVKSSDAMAADVEHQAIIETVRDLYYSLERPGDTVHRLSFQTFQLSIDCVGPCALALPDFLASTGYQNIESGQKCAWQKGHNTMQNAFEWLEAHPKQLEEFNQWMTAQRTDSKSFLEVLPIDVKALTSYSSGTVFVDIGGGVGHQCQAFLAAYPQFHDKIILQDLPHVLEHAPNLEGVSKMPWDFSTGKGQPVQNAKFYYLRNILHDFPHSYCRTILDHVKRAMGPDSKILIDEIVLAEKNVHWRAAQLDILMMTTLGAAERTRAQWDRLLGEVGMRIELVLTYAEPMGDSVIVAVPGE